MLATVHAPPPGHPAWSDPRLGAYAEPCRKHGGVPDTLDQVRARRAERGQGDVDMSKLMHSVRWSDMRDAVDHGERTGRVAVHLVAPLQRRI